MCPNIFFLEGIVPEKYTTKFKTYFYNENEYVALKYDKSLKTFFIVNEKLKQVEGKIHFAIIDDLASSLPKSPFGNFEFDDAVTIEVLRNFVSFVLERLSKKKIKKIRISTFSQAYDQHTSARICYVLLNEGFEISNTDMNHHIPIKGDFESSIKPMQFRKLLKARKENLLFKEEIPSLLEEIYSFILMCREEKNQSLSLSYIQLKNIVNYFPERYKLFVVRKGQRIIAATVVVVVNNEILYNFYPASDTEYNSLSPMVFLTEGLFNYCAENNYRILDLGTSCLSDKPNVGLINFKEGIGGEPSLKFTFEKMLD